MKVLVFGDTHIPSRRDSIPDDFFNHIEKTEYDLALITGDLVREQEMRAALPPLPRSFIVRGNMDYSTSAYNFHEQIQIESFDVLLLHGTQIRPRGNIHQLWEVADNIGAHVTIHGHTHQAAIDLYNDKLFLNPGTISGATGGWGGRTDASFIELDSSENELTVHLYLTDWKITKTSETKFSLENTAVKRM
ncbi:MAG: YfcE family phosphodiesterase [Candidatus Thorarchaeota archaeon]|nr:YfcE family phosphodiesterase [Candidatus Thorarchaeota archaeon]